jgi:hypothetical protein
MAFLFEAVKKEHLGEKDYLQDNRKSLGIKPRLHNEPKYKDWLSEFDASVYKRLADQVLNGIAACDPFDRDLSTAPQPRGQGYPRHAIWQKSFPRAHQPCSRWR